jgi:crotonobetainyl-CoA:carnitine CoA-transferase CaiB-like acyl-CoA transferase
MAGRNAHRLDMLPLVRAWVSQRSVAEVLSSLDQAEVPCAKIQTIDDVVHDPQIIARGMLVEQDHPVAGRITLPNVPFKFSGFDATIREPAPLLGQHNRQIAKDLGWADEAIEELINDGVLYAHSR